MVGEAKNPFSSKQNGAFVPLKNYDLQTLPTESRENKEGMNEKEERPFLQLIRLENGEEHPTLETYDASKMSNFYIFNELNGKAIIDQCNADLITCTVTALIEVI